jgi:Reversibly glycosylated polypeptide
MAVVVVIPNHLPHLDFLKEWKELKDVEIIVVQDVGDKASPPPGFNKVTVVDHADIQRDLKDAAWIIPTRTSACRSYGYYLAYRRGANYILTLDTDCYPEEDTTWLKDHLWALNHPGTLDWVNTIEGPYARGFPYLIRDKSETWLNHGLWSNIPDLDGPTMLHEPDFRTDPATTSEVIPRWSFFPMCGMNLAWRAELTPAMYFGLFGPEYGFDQFDDIWAGVLVKRVLDHLGHAVRSGYPSVEHRKQSNAFVNLAKQAPGMAANEELWKYVRDASLRGDTVAEVYTCLIKQLPNEILPKWMPKFKEAALIWASLFQS